MHNLVPSYKCLLPIPIGLMHWINFKLWTTWIYLLGQYLAVSFSWKSIWNICFLLLFLLRYSIFMSPSLMFTPLVLVLVTKPGIEKPKWNICSTFPFLHVFSCWYQNKEGFLSVNVWMIEWMNQKKEWVHGSYSDKLMSFPNCMYVLVQRRLCQERN